MDPKKFASLCKGKGMSFADYAKSAKSEGKDALDEDAYSRLEKAEDDSDDDGDGEEIEKSDLEKALADFEALEASRSAEPATLSHLRSRVASGAATADEVEELAKAMRSGGTDDVLSKSLVDQLGEDDDMRDLIDASPLLKSMLDRQDEGLRATRDAVTDMGDQINERLGAHSALVKALASELIESRRTGARQARVIDALEKRLGIVETTPTPRRSAGASRGGGQSREFAKSMTDDAQPTGPTRSDVEGALTDLIKKATDDGRDGLAKSLVEAAASYELGGRLPNNIAAAVREHLGAGA